MIHWTFSCLTLGGFLFSYKFFSKLIGKNQLFNSLFVGFYRLNFGLGMAWVIYACHSGHGGVVNRFLSSKFWIPLARLSYCLYLVSPVIQYNLISSKPHQLNLDIDHIVSLFCSSWKLLTLFVNSFVATWRKFLFPWSERLLWTFWWSSRLANSPKN